MFQNGQKVVVVSSGDPARVIKVQSASGTPDPSRYPIVDTTGVSGRDQSVQIVSGGDPTRFPILRGVSDARATADSVITALSPAAWYRNATGVTSAGGFASQWDDYSGNARHLKQTTGTNQPAYAAGVVTGDGADNFMIASFTLNQPSHVFAVIRQDSWTSNDRLFDGGAGATTPLFQRTASPNLSAFAGTSFIDSAPDPAVGDWFICQQFLSGASSFVGINDSAVVTGNAGVNNPGGITLFAQGGGAGTWGHASAKEIIIFSSEITGADLTALLAALNDLFTVY